MTTDDAPAPRRASASRWGRLFAGLGEGWRAALQFRPEAALIILGVVLLTAGQAAHPILMPPAPWVGSAVSVMGVLVFLLGAQAAQRGSLPRGAAGALGRVGGALGVREVQVVYLLGGILLAAVSAVSIDFGPLLRAPRLSISLWLAGILLTVLGVWRDDGARLPGRAALLGGLAFGAAAFALRATALTRIPVALTGDEASMGLSARFFLTGDANNPFTIGWFSFPALFYWLESLSIRVFGQTTLALRFPAALAGALTVGGVYLMGRALFGRLTGALAAIFLAGFHFHLHFSRLGLNNIWDGLAFVITLGALWTGWQRGGRGWFVLAGLWLGLAQYLYVSSRILFVLIPLWAGMHLLLDWQAFKRNWGGLLSLGLVSLVVIAPLGWYFSRNPHEFMAPLARVRLTPQWIAATAETMSATPGGVLLNQFWLALKAFTHEPLRAWYTPGIPLLRPLAATLFILGGLLLLLRGRDNRQWLLLLWLAGVVASTALSNDTPASQRYVVAAPLAALLVAYGLGETQARLAALWARQGRALAAAAVLVMLAVSAADAAFYFLEYTPATRLSTDNNAVAQRLADYLQEIPEPHTVYFFGAPRMGYYSLSSIPYLAPQHLGYDMNEPWGSPANPVVKGERLIFVFLPDKQSDLSGVQAVFPGGELLEEKTAAGDLIYWLYIP